MFAIKNSPKRGPITKLITHPAISKSPKLIGRIALKQPDGIHLIRYEEILYLNSDSNYTYVHLHDGKKLMVCRTLKSFTESLPNHQFIRVHQSYLVSINSIAKMNFNNHSSITLDNGIEISVSRKGKKKLRELLD